MMFASGTSLSHLFGRVPVYLQTRLTRPLPTKDGGTLRTVLAARTLPPAWGLSPAAAWTGRYLSIAAAYLRILSLCSPTPALKVAPSAAKARLSRSSRLDTHTRSIQAHFRAAQSSPPRPLWFCIADMHSRSSKGLSRHTIPCDRFELPHPSSDNPPACDGF
jgi:hypothetical protein